jgi:hypothetical protein
MRLMIRAASRPQQTKQRPAALATLLIPALRTVTAFDLKRTPRASRRLYRSFAMTAYVAATLQNLLLQRFTLRNGASLAQARAMWSAPVKRTLHGSDPGDTLPMLFRSEGFAEDLFDSHPAN